MNLALNAYWRSAWFRPATYIGEDATARASIDMTRDGFTLPAMGLAYLNIMDKKIPRIPPAITQKLITSNLTLCSSDMPLSPGDLSHLSLNTSSIARSILPSSLRIVGPQVQHYWNFVRYHNT